MRPGRTLFGSRTGVGIPCSVSREFCLGARGNTQFWRANQGVDPCTGWDVPVKHGVSGNRSPSIERKITASNWAKSRFRSAPWGHGECGEILPVLGAEMTLRATGNCRNGADWRQILGKSPLFSDVYDWLAETEGFEPSVRNSPYDGLANRSQCPLAAQSRSRNPQKSADFGRLAYKFRSVNF
jgi:hypothetical protein